VFFNDAQCSSFGCILFIFMIDLRAGTTCMQQVGRQIKFLVLTNIAFFIYSIYKDALLIFKTKNCAVQLKTALLSLPLSSGETYGSFNLREQIWIWICRYFLARNKFFFGTVSFCLLSVCSKGSIDG